MQTEMDIDDPQVYNAKWNRCESIWELKQSRKRKSEPAPETLAAAKAIKQRMAQATKRKISPPCIILRPRLTPSQSSPSPAAARFPAQPPARRVGGMFTDIYDRSTSLLAYFWHFIIAGLFSPPGEIVAVETDSSRRKRRAVSIESSSSITSTPSTDMIPGSFPEQQQLETPPDSRPGSAQSNGSPRQKHSIMPQATEVAPTSEPTGKNKQSQPQTMQAKEQAPPPPTESNKASAVAPPASQYPRKPLPLAGQRLPPVQFSCLKGTLPFQKTTNKTSYKRDDTVIRRLAPPVLKEKENADKDAEVDALIYRTKRAVIESPEQSVFRASVRERKERERAAVLKAKQDLEEREERERQEKLRKQAEEEAAQKAAEEEAKKALEEAAKPVVDKSQLIRPLDPEWEEKVNNAMASSNKRAVLTKTKDGVEMTRQDFGTLLPQANAGDNMSGWLNDEIVNGWLSAITSRRLEQTNYVKNVDHIPAIVSMNSAWLTTHKQKGLSALGSWARRKQIKGDRLLSCEKIYWPVNTGAHWTLLIMSPQARTIEYLDSLNTRPDSKFLKFARDWLKQELGDKYLANEWKELNSRSEMQSNDDDCGVFACFNALASAKGISYQEVEQRKMQDARRTMAAVLLNGGLSGDWEL